MSFEGNMYEAQLARPTAGDHQKRGSTMTYGYAMYQADRTPTTAEQREADARLGRAAAGLRRLSRPLAWRARARRRAARARQVDGRLAMYR
jgi:hypothetical protein